MVVGGSALSLEVGRGLRHLELAADLADSPAWLITGVRPDLFGMSGGRAHWLLGHDTEALSACHQAIKLSQVDPTTRSARPWRWHIAASPYQMRHDLPALRTPLGELRELCDRHGFAYYRETGD